MLRTPPHSGPWPIPTSTSHFHPFTQLLWPPGTRLQESSVAPSILVIEELDDKKNGGGKAARRAAAREN
jgi:hypothetical protein